MLKAKPRIKIKGKKIQIIKTIGPISKIKNSTIKPIIIVINRTIAPRVREIKLPTNVWAYLLASKPRP